MKVPTFFIVGAPKAGTTSLYAHLDQHPQVYLSPLAALLSRDLTAWLYHALCLKGRRRADPRA